MKSILKWFKRVNNPGPFNVSFSGGTTTHHYETSPPSTSLPQQPPHVNRDEVLHKERVTASSAEFPHAIAPPMNTEVPSTAMTTNEVSSSQHVVGHTQIVFSPPLPSLAKMERDAVENPFRPDGNLAHVVEPIVEVYKTRPFGVGDITDGGAKRPNDLEPQVSSNTTQQTNATPEKKSKKKNSSKKEKKEKQSDAAPAGVVVDVTRTTLSSPKAGQVEMVHLDEEETKKTKKKKCCGCF